MPAWRCRPGLGLKFLSHGYRPVLIRLAFRPGKRPEQVGEPRMMSGRCEWLPTGSWRVSRSSGRRPFTCSATGTGHY
jgi:hypothetical protein